MYQIVLDQNFMLGFENLGSKVRLIIQHNGVELACRMENIKKLNQFITEEQQHLFNGRLQLNKNGDEIDILYRGDRIGIVHINEFNRYLT